MNDKEFMRTFRFERHDPDDDVIASLTVTLRERHAPTVAASPNPHDIGQPSPFVTIDHREIMSYTELSVTGELRSLHEDSGGQCVDGVADQFPDSATAQRIRTLWHEYHLNGMNPGCIHQPDTWTCTHQPGEHAEEIDRLRAELDALYERRADPREIQSAAYRIKWAEEVQALAHDEPVLNGWEIAERLKAEGKTPPPGISSVGGTSMTTKSYGFRGDVCHVCGRSRWDEPSDKCPETGYRYGTSWLVRELPAEIERELRAMVDA